MDRRNEPIRNWEAGDRVQGFALISRKEVREDRRGMTFVDLEMADASGNMAGKVWADSPALEADFEAHDFVAFKGSVKLYRDRLQISINECRRATDDDRQYGFDEALLVPSTREDIDDLWRRLEAVLGRLERSVLARLAAETLDIYGERLKVHPAAKAMHHAFRGGLLEHVVTMAELAVSVCHHYPELDRDLMLLGVLFHDLGKLEELGAMPANEYTLEGRLVGHVVIGRDLLRERCAAIPGFPEDLRLHLEHLVLSHQGKKEYSSPVEPSTPEALALHFIDDLDSKLNPLRQLREEGAGLYWYPNLRRHVYLPEKTPTEETPAEGSPAEPERPGHGAPGDEPSGTGEPEEEAEKEAEEPADDSARPTLFDD